MTDFVVRLMKDECETLGKVLYPKPPLEGLVSKKLV